MKLGTILIAGTAVFAFALAGCLENETGADLDVLEDDTLDPLSMFNVQTTGCREGGGVSMYNIEEGAYLIEPYFVLHDIDDDMGNPLILSYGTPNMEGPSRGIHHISVVCEGHSVNGEDAGPLEWGWVGQRVHAPPWDDSGIERQYFIADLSFSNPGIVSELQTLTDLHVSDNCGSVLDYVQDTNLLHQILCDAEHGEFEVWQLQKDYRPLAERENVMRFWFLVAVGEAHGHGEEGGLPTRGAEDAVMYRPVAIDVVDTYHEGAKWRVIDNVRLLAHVFGVEDGETPGSHQGIFGGSVMWADFDREIRVGAMPDILVEDSWFH